MTPKQHARLEICRQHYAKSAGILEKAYTGKASARAAIRAKCLECCNFDRKMVDDCLSEMCPLWAYRPRFGENKALQMRRKKPRPAPGDGPSPHVTQQTPPKTVKTLKGADGWD